MSNTYSKRVSTKASLVLRNSRVVDLHTSLRPSGGDQKLPKGVPQTCPHLQVVWQHLKSTNTCSRLKVGEDVFVAGQEVAGDQHEVEVHRRRAVALRHRRDDALHRHALQRETHCSHRDTRVSLQPCRDYGRRHELLCAFVVFVSASGHCRSGSVLVAAIMLLSQQG